VITARERQAREATGRTLRTHSKNRFGR
jgi:hypothetical protein